jgi:hypothetical protein
MLTVACVLVGDKYSNDYGERLHKMAARWLMKRPFVMAVVTDRFADDRVTDLGRGLWVRTIPADPGLPGWWQKIHLFKPGLFQGRVLYLDLDVVVTGSLDELVEHKGIIQDWHYDAYNSSVMCWDVGEHETIWTEYASGRATLRNGRMTYRAHHWARSATWSGDQDYMGAVALATSDHAWKRFPPEWCVSYRAHAVSGPPAGAKVVCFHGEPKPHVVVAEDPGGWVAKEWQ